MNLFNKIEFVLAMFFFCIGHFAWAHGEDRPGPRGGIIRMPGAFHTELREHPKHNGFDLYLLDMNWKNPVTAKSTVKAQWKTDNSPLIELTCTEVKDHFECKLPRESQFRHGDEIFIHSVRKDLPGTVMKYQYPLTVPTKKKTNPHDNH